MAKDNKFRTSIGGQALIEGIMMRGPNKVAMVVRNQQGELETKQSPYKPLKERNRLLGIPILRGIASFIVSMKDGMGALTWSADFYPEEESAQPGKLDLWLEKHLGKAAEKVVIGVGVVLGLLLALGLFTVLPVMLGNLLQSRIASDFLLNLLETILRVALLVGYMLLVSRMKDIQRVFSYHGAEHKAIACYEAREELTAENVRKHSRFHPRCGTSFLLMVMIISMVAFLLVGSLLPESLNTRNPLLRIGIKLAILPLVVGLAYETNRLIGKFDNIITRILRAPGMWLQRLTTNEPDDSMIEVGIHALTQVMPESEGGDQWGK